MSTMISEVYDAFLSIGIAEDRARKAAEALYEQGINTLRSDMATLHMEMEKLRGEFNTLRWMLGFNLAISVALLFKAFS